jgi:hypothetical protein
MAQPVSSSTAIAAKVIFFIILPSDLKEIVFQTSEHLEYCDHIPISLAILLTSQ